MKRFILSALIAAGLLTVAAQSAMAATCNLTLSTPAASTAVRGAVNVTWAYSGGCIVGNNVRVDIIGGAATTQLGVITYPLTSATWSTSSFSDGTGYTVSITPLGANGGSTRSATSITVDNTAPVIGAAAKSPTANPAGWNNTPTTVSFPCTDATSGVVSSSSSTLVSTEGANQDVVGTCTDRAGNTAQRSAPVSIDLTAPSITFVSQSPTANVEGWNSSAVTLSWSCVDALSGATSANVTREKIGAEGANQGATGVCTDAAGNSASDEQGGIDIDLTAPSTVFDGATPEANAAGWNASAVTLAWSCTDALSGATSANVTREIGAEGANQGATGVCTDAAGNSASDEQGGIDIDLTAPSTVFDGATPEANAAGWNASAVTLAWSCTDALSGATSANVTREIGAEGANQGATGVCTDAAGNSDSDEQGGIDIDLTDSVLVFDGATPEANTAGWNASAVTLAWSCTDALSGATSANVTREIGAEGANQGATGVCTDAAGNSASDEQGGIDIDLTAPVLVFDGATPEANAAGWNSSAVTLAWSCTDPLSGVDAAPTSVELSTEGANQGGSASCTDLAGNSDADALDGIDIDLTAPVLVFDGATPEANAAGWNSSAVTLAWSCTDALSGVDAGPDNVALSTEGTDQGGLGVCTDAAGNSASDEQGGIDIDLTDPVLVFDGATPEANAAGWNSSAVTLAWSCTDALSDVGTGPSNVELSTEGADQGGSASCSDVAGNSASDEQGGIDIDLTDPVLVFDGATPEANAAGWNSSAVTLAWSCTDALSDVGTGPSNVELSTEGADQGGSASCTDVAGNSASDEQGGIDIDLTDPVLVFDGATPEANAAGWNSSAVTLAWSCTDALSDVGTGPSNVELSTEGADQGGSASCSDVAGNSASDEQGGIDIDLTDPVLVFDGATPEANAAGWNSSAVTLAWSCTDALSDVGTGPSNVELSTEGADQGGSASCTDVAGNSASDEQGGIDIDLTVPEITGAAATEPNEAGWYASTVTIVWTCSDDLSGVSTCPEDSVIDTDGEDLEVSAIAYDAAGNSRSATVTGINIDRDAPQITADRTVEANENGWNRTAVTVTWSCDDENGASPSLDTHLFSAEGAEQSASSTCTDIAGNTTSDTQTVNIDMTAPATDAAAVLLGDVAGTASDNLSGVADVLVTYASVLGDETEVEATCVSGCGTTTMTWTSSAPQPRPNVYRASAVATDLAGNVGTATDAGHVIAI